MRAFRSSVAAVGLSAAVTVAAALAAPAPTRHDSQLLQQKVATINELAQQAVKSSGRGPRGVPHRTVITENEVNSYLALDSAKDLPAGVVNPSIAILGDGRLSGHAVVDLDAVRKASPPKSLLDPKNLLIGRVPLTATGVLTTSNGTARFMLESANVGNLPLPKLLLDEVVSYYTRSPERPGGLSIDDPFALPAAIREIQVTRGQAVVIQ